MFSSSNYLPCSVIASFLLMPLTVSAEVSEQAQKLALTDQNFTGNLLQTTFGLIIILVAIGGLAWLVKRFGNVSIGAQGKMKIVGGLSLGARERVVLLEVGDKQLLVGVAPGRIQTLHVLDEPIPVETRVDTGQNFASKLQAALGGLKK